MVDVLSLKAWIHIKPEGIVSADEAHAFAKKHGIRIIPTRWVLGPKVVNGKEAVRARCVVQDVAKGSTASSLGLSATTPSLEALRNSAGHCCQRFNGYCNLGCLYRLSAFPSAKG